MGKYNFAIYLGKFLGTFCILYFGTKAIIGITVPGGYYIDFVHRYFDYISALRKSLLYGAQFVLSLGGYHSNIKNAYMLAFENGRGIRLVYGCLGYGIISFWLAFVFANKGSITKKTCWMVGGFLAIWVINVIRISLFLLAVNKGWAMPLGIDHHTWFDIAAYACLFLMIYVFDKSGKTVINKENEVA